VIRYQLQCSRGHGFEGWFRNSAAYDREVEALDCPICGDRSIEKAIMAPAVLQRAERATGSDEPAAAGTGSGADVPAPAAPSPGAGTTAVAAPSPPPLAPEQVQLAKAVILMRQLRAHVEANFEHVGPRFAEEARKIHYNETEPRGIYGQASRDEVLSLEDEGIDILPLPDLPKLDG
jgi:hypothetical protein